MRTVEIEKRCVKNLSKVELVLELTGDDNIIREREYRKEGQIWG